jgi:hypothetical protein
LAKQKHLSISILNKIQRLVYKKDVYGFKFYKSQIYATRKEHKAINYGEKDAICAMLRVKNTEFNSNKTLFS